VTDDDDDDDDDDGENKGKTMPPSGQNMLYSDRC